MRPSLHGTGILLTAGALLCAGAPAPIAAQAGAAGPYRAVAALPHPWTTMVAITVLFPVGSASDPPGLEGSAYLLGETVRRTVAGVLGERAAEMDVEVDRSRTSFRLLASPEAWRESFGALEGALFEGELRPAAYEAARLDLADVFRFEIGAPVREFQTEMYRLMGGLSNPWSRSPRGSPESLTRIRFADLVGTRMQHFHRGRAVVTVTGPVDPGEVFRAVAGTAAPPERAPGRPVVSVAEEHERTTDEAWDDGDRLVMRRDVTNSWIAVAWPVDPESSRTALEMLVHRLGEGFNTSPPDPSLFAANVRLEDVEGHTVLLVEAAVLPEAAESWERRILAAVGRIEDEDTDPSFFRWQRRRFRSIRLLEEAAPEAQGLRAAEDLLREGRVRDLTREIWSLGSGDLPDVVDELEDPRILVFGPDLTDEAHR